MEQIEKNTVSSKGQLKENEFVTFVNSEGKGKRVLFVGNSITRHGVRPEIGWNNDWGMAASDINKDYVHTIITEINKKFKDAAFCICQVANWEREYKNGDKTLYQLDEARSFNADTIIMRIIENCPQDGFECNVFSNQYQKLIDYFNTSQRADIILTTGFWKHIGDKEIEQIAGEKGYKFVYLGDLGEEDKMKAIGLFEHEGVANLLKDLNSLYSSYSFTNPA